MSKVLEGYVDDGHAAPLSGVPAIATVVGTGVVVGSTATDADGHWYFDALDPTLEYFVNVVDIEGNAVVRGPWSGEVRDVWVRDRLAMSPSGTAELVGVHTLVDSKPLVLDPNPANGLVWGASGLFSASGGLTQSAADLRYVNLDGDTMVGDLTTTGLTVQYTSNLADAHFTGDVDVTASLWVGEELRVGTLPGNPVVVSPTAGNTLTWDATGLYSAGGMTQAAADTRYVNTTGDTMSGSLAIVNSTSTRISNVRAAGSLQRPGIDFERWKTTVDTIEEVAVGSTIGTFGFNASGATNLAYGGSIYAYVDAPIVGGTAPIAFSFYHATLGETYRLDSQGRGWFAPPADTSIFPATPGLYISGKWVGVSPTAGNSLTWNANGFYVNVPAVTDLWVNTTGDTMDGLLNMHGAAAATVVFQAKLPADTQPRFTVRADGRLDWGGGAAVAVDVPMYRVTAGDFRIGANFSGSTNNTRDLGFGTVQWKAIYGNQLFLSGDGTSGPAWAASGALRLRNAATGNIAWRNAANAGDLTLGVTASDVLTSSAAFAAPSAVLTTSLTVASKAVGVSATGGNTLAWNSDGFYVAAGAVTDIWVNTTGDTMTGDLNMTANVLPTTTNVRSLGSTSLRWLKVWAQDADFTNAPTVGGAALLTATAADALFLTPAEGNAAYAALAHNHDAAYVQLTGGSVMTGLLGPTTNNTRDLGTTALRWRKLWGVDADLSGALAVLGAATVSGLLKGQAGLDITGNAVFDTSNVSINGTLGTTGLATLATLDVTGKTHIGPSTNEPTTLTEALTIQGNAAAGGIRLALTLANNANAGGPWQNFYRARGTLASRAIVQNNDGLAAIWSYAYDGANYISAGLIAFEVDGVPGLNDMPTRISFQVAPDGSPTPVERLRISNTGVVNAVTALQVNSRPVIMAGCRVYNNANQNVASTTNVSLAFNVERFDTDNFHDNVTNNSRLTVPAGLGGTYLIYVAVNWAAAGDSTGRILQLRVNGATYIALDTIPALSAGGQPTRQSMSTVWNMAAGDYVEIVAHQLSVGTITIDALASFSPEFGMQRIG